MNWHDLVHQPLVHRLGWTLLHSLWQDTAIAACLAMALAWLRRATPQARYAAATVALGLMLAIPAATFCLLSHPSPPGPAVLPGPQRVASAPAPGLHPAGESISRVDPGDGPVRLVTPATAPSFQAWLAGLATRLEPLLPWVVAFWCVGVLALGVWHLGGWIAAQRLRALGTRPVAPGLAVALAALSARMGLRRPVWLFESLLATTPMVVGWWRPVILVPGALLTQLTPGQIEAILAHELAHVRRYDYLVNLLQGAVETLLFYPPAAWWASRRVRVEREHCCDEVAAGVCGDRREYARALTAVEELRSALPLPVVAARAAAGGEFISRIRRVLGLGNASARVGPRPVAGALGAAAMLAVVAGLYLSARGQSTQRASMVHSGPAFVAVVPGGPTVELIGVAENPSDHKAWWKPDGSPLAQRPYDQSPGSVAPDEGSGVYEFAIRLTGHGADAGYRWAFDPPAGSTVSDITVSANKLAADLKEVVALPHDRSRRVTVKLGLACGPWMPLASADGAYEQSVYNSGIPPQEFWFTKADDDKGGAVISVAHEVLDQDVRLIAVDKNGAIHDSAETKSWTKGGAAQVPVRFQTPGQQQYVDAQRAAGKLAEMTARFPGLKVSDVREFRFEWRPYQWVEFHNVSLAPGWKTDVTVSTPAAAEAPQTQPGGRAPGADNTSGPPRPNQPRLPSAATNQGLRKEDFRGQRPEATPATRPAGAGGPRS